jgi:hypothetical protein
VKKNYQLYFGMDNAFDKKAPPIISGLPGNTTGTETDASAYDPIGRHTWACAYRCNLRTCPSGLPSPPGSRPAGFHGRARMCHTKPHSRFRKPPIQRPQRGSRQA